jgi:magnesium chelatase family protein
MLVASANPCPCGFLNHPKKACNCTPREIHKYHKRVSGPILDRIDLHVDTPDVDVQELAQDASAKRFLESSLIIQSRVAGARNTQEERFARLDSARQAKEAIHTNTEMKNAHIKKYCALSREAEGILLRAAQSFQLSARSYYKVIKIARTIADLEGAHSIAPGHIAEALQYRPKVYGST